MTAVTETKKIVGWDEKFDQTYGIKKVNGKRTLTLPVLFQLYGPRKPKPKQVRTKKGQTVILPFAGEHQIQGWCYYNHPTEGPNRMVLNSMTDVFNWKKDELPKDVRDIVFMGGDFWVTPDLTNWEQVLTFLHYHPRRKGSPCEDVSQGILFEYINEIAEAENIGKFLSNKIKLQNKLLELDGYEILQRCAIFNINTEAYDISDENHASILRGQLINAVDVFFNTRNEIEKQNLIRDWDNQLILIGADVNIGKKAGVIEFAPNGRVWKWKDGSPICAVLEGIDPHLHLAEHLFQKPDQLKDLQSRITGGKLEDKYAAQQGTKAKGK